MNKKSEASRPEVDKEFGVHFIVELIDCPPDKLAKVDEAQKIMVATV